MEIKILKPRKAINKAFLKIKPNRTEIESFKTNLIELLDRTNDTESEEFHKNLVSDFLKDTYYKNNHFINTKGRNDLVIHNGNKAKSTVGVIIEAKKPTNKAEMLTKEKINVKAFQELVLYYLRERITQKNLEIKYLVATNINEWFIFDSNVFEKQFAQNKGLVKQFNDFENGRLAGKTTDFFYKEIAEPFVNGLKNDIEFTFFDIREYEKPLRNNNPKDDNKLISLYKLLSPEHLLKLPFANDSNSLDKRFYGELLHIIGLSETKNGSKRLIERNKKGERNTGSFLENAIIQLDSLDKINRLDNPSHFGTTQEERLFNVGLELSITWINRILFLKLLEAQLKTYHKGDKSYEFLSFDKIQNYDDLNSLFFQVLAKQQSERNEDVTELFAKVPYLNSSLFEPTGIEHGTLFISNLRDDKTIPIYSSTVLKNESGKKRTGNLNALEYLFEFLNAYDFSSEGKEEIQEDNKTLINASVLGLIFEKINGYKDGSFFTPGFITMYMCRETIRKAVIQKFNETKDWNCKDIDSLYDKIEDRQEANNIINSLKICDPAVGSGHFLVSALNEMIAIKNDLKILQDRDGKRLKEYQFEVVNDELIVTDEDGELFEYNPTNKESQRIQETLFHEKQTIIENCLFGVDINPNSVKICRLRLWIELLKNAYYKNESELETLPNIDINIKCGNSLISRFELDADLKKALKSSKWTIDSYKLAVDTYRNAQNKEQKREMEKLIDDIKNDFRSEISLNDPKVKRLKKIQGEIFGMTNQTQMFELTKREKTAWNKKLKKLTEDSKKLETIIEEIKNNKIYEEAFEWRFEFPEVLDDNGDFVGFDAVIGNPPYIFSRELITKQEKNYFYDNYKLTQFKLNTYILFSELASKISNSNSTIAYIIPNNWLTLQYNSQFREFILNEFSDVKIVNDKNKTFEDASVDASILLVSKMGIGITKSYELNNTDFEFISETENTNYLNDTGSIINYGLYRNPELALILNQINNNSKLLETEFIVKNGVQAYTVGEGIPTQTKEMKDQRVYHTNTKIDDNWKKYIDGSDVSRYGLNWTGLYIKYGKNLSRRRTPDLFTGERIYVRQIPSKPPYAIVSTLINIDAVCDNNHMIIKSKEEHSITLKSLIGILNSKLITFWFASTFGKHQRKLFPQFKVKELQIFPIPKNISPILQEIEKSVNTLSIEYNEEVNNKIDSLVYELYDLKKEQIEIIESNLYKIANA
ncbi:type II restriction endonuclease [Patiriisocius marinus]|uniref:site-specific DNA-methyltransferase (adenine-specific) n=1 Tax=Patiriisocius marinus TaxID=1397112 RepID=A0A5J4IZR9_9FLAO|nr:TaqI-like C-terminal specificity domain-containing protein [Patiriisocius marinus]GER59300.1 type II restriction endonuclease [Patiriisocius marinus]